MAIQIGQRQECPDYHTAWCSRGIAGILHSAAPKHTADEEESLFPRLRDSSDPRAIKALALVERLERDHGQAEQHHAAIACRKPQSDGTVPEPAHTR